MTFHPLASSSKGCAYLLEGEGRRPLLIDAGMSYRKLQQAIDFRVTELAGCLVSHYHGDHCHAVPGLLQAGVDCFASAETWQKLGFTGHHRAKCLHDQSTWCIVYEGVRWSILPFLAVHDAPGTMGFLIRGASRDQLLYLTDSCYCPHRFQGLTHIAIECNYDDEIIRDNVRSGAVDRARYRRTVKSHMSIERLETMLKSNDLSSVREIHLLHLSDANSDEIEFKKRIQRLTGKPVYVAPSQGVPA